jgi:hypothetical protein
MTSDQDQMTTTEILTRAKGTKWVQNGTKMVPKWYQNVPNGTKMYKHVLGFLIEKWYADCTRPVSTGTVKSDQLLVTKT